MGTGNGVDRDGWPTDYVRADRGSAVILSVDKSVGKQFLLIIWISAVVTALSIVGMWVAYDAFRVTRQHVKILEYDLMDLRSKTGNAHQGAEGD